MNSKIVQISVATSEEYDILYGISEAGNLYSMRSGPHGSYWQKIIDVDEPRKNEKEKSP